MSTPADTGPSTDPERPRADSGPGAEARHDARPLPRRRAIRWMPRKFGVADPSISTSYEVLLTREALRSIDEQMSVAPGREIGGLLAGRLYRCPDTERPYIVVDHTVPCPRKLPEETAARESGVADLEAAFEELWESATADGRVLAGWYHNHTLLGVFLSERDARFHLRRFSERWQCALVRIGGPERPAGGLFQWTERGGLRRNICLPFWELAEEGADGPADPGRSAVDWRNYVVDPATVPADDSAPDVAGPERPEASASAASARPEGSAPAAGRPPAGERARPEGASRPEEADPRRSDAGPARRAPGRGPPEPPGREGGGAGREPPPGRPGPPARRPPSRGEVELPLILPPDRPEDRFVLWRRHRRALTIAGAAVLVLAAGWLLYALLAGGGRERETASAAEERFAALAADFEESAAGFRRLGERFEAGGVDCAPLTAAYREVDGAFLALSEHFARIRDELGSVPLARYESIARDMEELDSSFNATGCPRPT